MELKHIISKDEEKKSVTLLLYGAIGGELNGHYFAQEINYLSEYYDEIVIRINSEGGSVIEGLSIFNAVMLSKAKTVCHIEGVAASMAGVIPMAADKVIMNDFARIMLHNPFVPGRAKLSKKEEAAVANFKQVLTDLVSKRYKGNTSDMLDAETWFDAKDAMKEGLIDEIVNTGQYEKVNNELSLIAATAITSDLFSEYLSINNRKEMKEIASLFGLEATAKEIDIVNEIKALQLKAEALKQKETELNELANTLRAELKEQRKKEVEDLADKAISAGYFDKDKRSEIIALGEQSFDAFKKMIDSLKPVAASLSAVIASAQPTASGAEEKKDFVWYSKHEPETLAEMKTLEPERYKKLEKEYAEKYL